MRRWTEELETGRGSGGRRGFTLIELMVVVAIIVVLIAILVPSLGHVQKAANRTHIRAQLSTLQTALQAYYGDFNMYPPSTPSTFIANPPGGPAVPINRGSAMLAQGLMGYLAYVYDGAGPGNPNATPASPDPAFGFRVRQGGQGRVYGPYAPNDPKGYKVTGPTDQAFVDLYGDEILYYRSTRAGANATLPAPQYIFGTAANAYFVVSDNLATPPMMPNGPKGPRPGMGADPGWQFYTGILQTADGTGANKYSGGTVLGSDSYLLISGADDKTYFDDDDIVVGKQ